MDLKNIHWCILVMKFNTVMVTVAEKIMTSVTFFIFRIVFIRENKLRILSHCKLLL